VIKFRLIRLEGHEALIERRRDVYKVFVAKLEGKKPLGRPTPR
jgi:hypothetical protein